MKVSIDMSTDDATAHHRIYGNAIEENDNTLKSTRKLPCYMSQYDSYKE